MSNALRDLYYRLPSGLQRAVLVRRRAPIWLRSGIVFIHVPKAAGTSINEALYGQFMGHVRASDVKRWGSTAVKTLPSFAVTRNPWSRLLSAYRFAKRGSGVGGRNQAGVWRPERYGVREFETFETFVTGWLVNRNVKWLDNSFQPQITFVCDRAGNVLVDHVGRVENLRSTYEFIRQHVGGVPEIDQSNRSGKSLDYRQAYTPQMIEIVGRIYAEDAQTFGYSFGD